ncbi:hypothetical protein K6U06_05490 [Acidiferrimicrobium sp. IK]|uniref:hypothetical protein n=1 Tax=Acidiferrimicrobium sp. IK TaxID=2871700 RepID=UPI0021CB0F5C|nr:hypothetical protein [Acidiferrimicrobium sp. IK]MCU4183805.1 hypothetical protein [Acidiferrimicrobium sp. IK]
MGVWYSIEVFDGSSSASVWAEAHGDVLMETALTSGATDWTWHRHSWGVAFEVEFPDTAAWEAYRAITAVQTSLDAVPDPLTGLIVYRGRGGGAGSPLPRKPRPMIGSGSAALPLPWELGLDELTSVWSIVAPVAPAAAVACVQSR